MSPEQRQVEASSPLSPVRSPVKGGPNKDTQKGLHNESTKPQAPHASGEAPSAGLIPIPP